MASELDTTSAAQCRATRRNAVSAAFTSVSATGVLTVPAGFLDDLQNGDIVRLSALTGGSSLVVATDYYVTGLAGNPAAGATTCQLATSADLAWITHGSNVTVGTITKGKATGTATGGPSPQSARGR